MPEAIIAAAKTKLRRAPQRLTTISLIGAGMAIEMFHRQWHKGVCWLVRGS